LKPSDKVVKCSTIYTCSPGFCIEACPARNDPENPLSTHKPSKTLEKLLSHGDKHYAFQASKQKETWKLQNQNIKSKETPIKKENRKRGDSREKSPCRGGFKPHPGFLRLKTTNR
jgi:hypothetical protein